MPPRSDVQQAILLLEDGTVFYGRSFGASGETCGEVVFNTAMTGYQEIATDPSYYGQLVVMTYPLIGNYGVNQQDAESRGIFLKAMIVKELAGRASNYRSEDTLDAYYRRAGIMGLEDIDTRALVLHLRRQGAMRGILSTIDDKVDSLMSKVLASPKMEGQNCVDPVTVDAPFAFPYDVELMEPQPPAPDFHVAVFDFGIKENILRQLAYAGIRCTVVPANTKAAEIERLQPDGVFLSNGPGDPDALPEIIAEIRQLLPKFPAFGICLGCQLMGLALGGQTAKLKFGHRGANHPVKDLATGRVEITSQNHGFYVVIDSLPTDAMEVTHLNLNDQTAEGLRHKQLPLFAIQYHPEASPGPHDSHYLFQRFYDMIKENKQ